MAELNILEAIRRAMDEELAADERVMVLGEDVGQERRVRGYRWPVGQVRRQAGLDTPLSEGLIAGAAMGAAL